MMSFYETFTLAIKNILSSKMRTFLTMLGIIIGITAVTVIVGLGNGLSNYMTEQFAALGTKKLTVTIVGRGSTRSISVDDMYELVEENSDLFESISPSLSLSGTIKVGTTKYTHTTAKGVSEDYVKMQSRSIALGRDLTYTDVKDRKPVCIIGNYLAQNAYGGKALGQTININGKHYQIIGVLKQEAEGEMEEGGDDDCVYLPYTTVARASNISRINSYEVNAATEDCVSEAKAAVENRLYQTFNSSNYYFVMSMKEMLDTMTGMVDMVILILTVIAGISLLVGGIGIMNIMLVSVTERTREIGIRKALGARENVILLQFVVEAGTTSALGGVIGIVLGYILSMIATPIVSSMMDSGTMTVSPSLSSALIAFAVSVGIGVLFGFLPARKAARLNPIDALRQD